MSEAPDRIWVIKEDVAASWPGSFRRFLGSDLNHGENGTEYVRADITERQLAEARAELADKKRRLAEERFIAGKAHEADAKAFLAAIVRAEKAEAERGHLAAEVARLLEALKEHVTENVWNAYNIGIERDGRWMDGARSEGEWLAGELGLPAGWNDAALVKSMLPGLVDRIVARAALASVKE